jgi:hypothetical protein
MALASRGDAQVSTATDGSDSIASFARFDALTMGLIIGVGQTPTTVSKLLTEHDTLESHLDLVEAFPEVTSIPGWTPPVTLQLLDCSELAPKDETVIYKQHAQIFRYRCGEWKERGTGDVMILMHKITGVSRFLMWQDRTYKTIANSNLVDSSSECCLHVHEDDPKTWSWHCQDHSDDRPTNENFALHFKTEELALQFKNAFNEAKLGSSTKETAVRHDDYSNVLSPPAGPVDEGTEVSLQRAGVVQVMSTMCGSSDIKSESTEEVCKKHVANVVGAVEEDDFLVQDFHALRL